MHLGLSVEIECLPATSHKGQVKQVAQRALTTQCQFATAHRAHGVGERDAQGVPIRSEFVGFELVALVARRWGNGLDGVFRSVDVTLSAMASDHARPTVLIPFDFLDGGLASECAPSAGAMGRFGIMTPRTTA